jgi:hypothetical protein
MPNAIPDPEPDRHPGEPAAAPSHSWDTDRADGAQPGPPTLPHAPPRHDPPPRSPPPTAEPRSPRLRRCPTQGLQLCRSQHGLLIGLPMAPMCQAPPS